MHTDYLTFHHWAAFSPDRKELGEWVAWALGQSRASGSSGVPYKAELPGVPAMLRRRLSGMGKAALWCAGQVLDANTGPAPVTRIFCSQHGEVSRTVALLKDLAEQSPLSPASFSLSVHNAIGGIHSIAGDVEQPVTAIAAGPDSPFSALLEAWSQLKFRQLNGGCSERALCVIYDDALPEDVADPENRRGDVQAIALLVSCGESQQKAGDALTLSFTLADDPGADEAVAEGAAIDTLLKFLLDNTSRNMAFRGDGRTWSWGKHGGGAPQVHS
ncbi:beta-ketoacyl synthase chain length factor [Marinobacter changyiensis]|uniref:beta-ketoacyl synthase chain length factor n=1 Tax=Marinobacter changyiensis TaxID=2604091 RepID=UPI001264F56D|nr:beta-ketoacyl synthase chain length factor [Marinobacter changyiensis]